MDPIISALFGYGLNKALDGVLASSAQRRALKNALGRALTRFRDQYPDVMGLILADRGWEFFQEELKLLVTADQHPDAARLAKRLAGEDAGKAERLQKSLSELFRWVRNEAALEPKLAALQVFRLEEEVADRLAEIERALGIGLDVTKVLVRAREASRADIETFQAVKDAHDYGAQLDLRYSPADGAGGDIGLDDIVESLCAGQRIILEGLPGFGKSTTALRIASRLAGEEDVTPLYVPLGDWAVGRRGFFEEIAARDRFSARALRARHIQFLAERRRIVLLLDGWNELSGEKLERAHTELRKFLREHPTVGVVVTMRPTVQRPPIKHAFTVKVPPLDRDQRDAVIRAQTGDEAEDVIDRIRRQRDLDEITRIPLYLATYLRVMTAGFVPRSKEELLRDFVRSHESSEEHQLPLQQVLRGFQDEFLQDLAVRMLAGGGPALSGEEARQIVSSTGERLVGASQVGVRPDPSDVLSTLVAHHLLVAVGKANEVAYSFQHQQFQEWFASRHVEAVILKAVEAADDDSARRLRTEIIDVPFWEEPILFAVERLANKGPAGEAAAACVIELALQVAPMLAARMVYQSGENVWNRVKDVITDFAERWHRDHAVDRALGFMITTGRPEFSEVIWPYVGHDDMQVRLRTLRKASPFRPGVLGKNWRARLKGLSEEAQKNLLVELIMHGGIEGIALAAEAAQDDVPDSLKIEVIEALEFRHAFTHMKRLLGNASDGVWQKLAERGRLEFDDDAIMHRVIEEKRTLAASMPRGTGRARILLSLARLGVNEAKPQLIAEIGHPEFEADADYGFSILQEAASIDAAGVSIALVQRLIAGLPLGWHARSLMQVATEDQKREILDRLLDGGIDQRRFGDAGPLLGQEQIAVLVDRYFETASAIQNVQGRAPQELRDQYRKWQDIISSTNLSDLLDVIFARDPVATVWEINAQAELLARHGGRYDRDSELEIPERHENPLRTMLERWLELLKSSPSGNRYVMSRVADVLECIARPENLDILVSLLDFELAQKRADDDAFRAWLNSGQRGEPPKEARTGTAFAYRRAFQAIPGVAGAEAVMKYLDDAEFGPEAAQTLRYIGVREAGLLEEKTRFSRWPDYSGIRERHRRKAGQEVRPKPHPYAAAILDVVARVMGSSPDQAALVRAVKLCVAATGLEYGDRLPEIMEVLERSGAHREKIGCFLNLMLAGENMPADLLEPGCEAAFQRWREQGWHQENDWWQLEKWLVLQALSAEPHRLLGRVESLEEAFRRPWQYEEIVRALGASPYAEAADVLVRLGDVIPELQVSHAWIKAATERDEAVVTDAMMDMLWDPNAAAGLHQSHHDSIFSSALAARIRENNGLKQTLRDRLSGELAAPVRGLALQVVENLGEEEQILAALNQISDASPDRAPFHLRQAIENLVTNRVPVEGWPSAYSIVPARAAQLRASLFRMAYEDAGRQNTARALLEWTDELRDEYGRPDDEPRHPNIGSGMPWPMLP